jgi:acetyltransferase-like isoleucine patch superfamily enzyme
MRLASLLRALRLLGNRDLAAGLADLQRRSSRARELHEAFPLALLDPDVLVQGWPEGRFDLAHVRVERGAIFCLGDDVNGYGSIRVGEGTWIGQYNNIRTSHDAHILIGRRCLVSQFCSIIGANHGIARDRFIQDQPVAKERSGVTIGDDVWLGAGCTILPGVELATGSVIGANSVVTRNVGAYEIWCGAPAVRVGERS